MDSIILYNQNGQKFDVDVVRYFKQNGNKYLIFSLNEKDGNGYHQLYASKIEEEAGKKITKNITDDNEWSNFKTDIQKIVTNNRNNIPNEDDIDYKELDGSTVSEFRIFKLKEDVAATLADKKNPKKEETTSQIEIPSNNAMNLEAASAHDSGLSIEEILQKVSESAKNAREEAKIDLNSEDDSEDNEDSTLVKKTTIEDLLKTPIPEAAPSPAPTPVAEVSSVPEVEQFVQPEMAPQVEPKVEIEPKFIPTSDFIAEARAKVEETDYKVKYEEAEAAIHRLEEENMRLINELVEAKAKVETIKDILD
ncbi:MAG: DUF1292 domain-containing protein [Bacilli bacterium]|nr:DUF1292 domain-containing protein [Bacilli bacterium]